MKEENPRDEEPQAARPPARDASSVQSVRRAARLLEALAHAPAEGEQLSRLAGAAGLDRSTTRRLLSTMIGDGLVDQNPASRLYQLGLSFFTLAAAASNRYDLQKVAGEAIRRLAGATGDSAMFALRSGDDVVCIDVAAGGFPVQVMPMDIGSRRPLGAGAIGAAVMVGLPEEEVERLLAAGAARLSLFRGHDPARVRAAIARGETEGVVEAEEAAEFRARSVAAPLIDRRGRPIGCIAAFATPERLTGPHRSAAVAALKEAARDVEGVMWKMPDTARHRTSWAAAQ